jgi:hypothetical protein
LSDNCISIPRRPAKWRKISIRKYWLRQNAAKAIQQLQGFFADRRCRRSLGFDHMARFLKAKYSGRYRLRWHEKDDTRAGRENLTG